MSLKIKITLFLTVCCFILGGIFLSEARKSGKFRLIACDVGQGDGLLLISPGGSQVVVDGGPGNAISGCLSRYMPFWDRTLEAIVLTHPHSEHMEGFLDVFAKYKVKTVVTTQTINKTALFKEWEKAIKASGARVYVPKIGDRLKLDKLTLEVMWPTQDKIALWRISPPSDLNDTSILMRADYGNFCAYLTGDLPKEVLAKLIDRKCDVLKVVHHGSRTGTNDMVVSEISPKIALIQVGAKNSYGHPHAEVLDALRKYGVKILRNDLNGNIEVDSSGSGFTVTTDR